MNKIKALVFTSCILSLNAFAQIPTESFKPINVSQANLTPNSNSHSSSNSSGNNVNTPISPNPSIAPNPAITTPNVNQGPNSNPTITSVPSQPLVPVAPLKDIDVNKRPNVNANGMTDIQVLSTQSNEEYLKRRNSSFESELTKCIDEIPKDKRGQRSSDAMLKCASVSKAYTTGVNANSVTKPSYLSDSKPTAVPAANTAQNVNQVPKR